MRLIDRLTSPRRPEQRYSLSDWLNDSSTLNKYSHNGISYTPQYSYKPGDKVEPSSNDFRGHADDYRGNSVVFACMTFRASVFAEARFQFQQIRNGRPGDLFGTPDLAVLETPWPNGTTGELLARMVNDVDLCGNFYGVRRGSTIYRLRPDWVDVVLTKSSDEWDAEPFGYIYWPGGKQGKGPDDGEHFTVEEVCHWAPKPDPQACYRGMSPLTPLVREILGDAAMSSHKQSFLDNAATPNMVVKADATISFENFKKFKESFQDDHEGALNAYRTMFIGGGADVTVVGADMKQLDFVNTQGRGETRIAAAFETPPVLVGLSEGLQAATYSNYASARRRFADGTARPLWRSASAALQTIVPAPNGARLWYDDRDVAFLREDAKDDAAIKQTEAGTIRQLVDAGFKPESVTAAVISGDYTQLVHTGLFSVQLQPPGTQVTSSPSTTTN